MRSIHLNRSSRLTLAEQIRKSIETRIMNGSYRSGQRLPSTRHLSEDLGVSRSTVSEAFDMLMADGLINGVTGSGTYVASIGFQNVRTSAGPTAQVRPAELPAATHTVVNAFSWGPTLDYFPFDTWQQIGTEQAARVRELVHEADPAGYRPLRIQIARLLERDRGLMCDPDQIMITSGMTQGLDLAARTLLRPGDTALMEDPAEMRVRTTLTLAGANVVPVSVDKDGLDIRRAPRDFRLVHLSPIHQFPSGAILSAEREAMVRRAVSTQGAYILEMDNTFLVQAPRLPLMAGMSGDASIIHLGTMSWTLFRSLRIGYLVAAPEMIARLVATRAAMDFRPPLIEQYMIEQFMREGHYDAYVEKMRGILAVRQRTLAASWPARMPEGVMLSPHPGGLGHMVTLPDGTDIERVLRRAAARGLEPRDISPWFADPNRRALLLGFAYAGEFTTINGLRELADILATS